MKRKTAIIIFVIAALMVLAAGQASADPERSGYKVIETRPPGAPPTWALVLQGIMLIIVGIIMITTHRMDEEKLDGIIKKIERAIKKIKNIFKLSQAKKGAGQGPFSIDP